MKYSAPLAPPPPYKSIGTRAQKVAPAWARRLAFYAVRRFCQYPLVALALLPLL